jgi:hypothetical protein
VRIVARQHSGFGVVIGVGGWGREVRWRTWRDGEGSLKKSSVVKIRMEAIATAQEDQENVDIREGFFVRCSQKVIVF